MSKQKQRVTISFDVEVGSEAYKDVIIDQEEMRKDLEKQDGISNIMIYNYKARND